MSKSRWYSFIVYPESAPSDWIERLNNSLEEFAISPCHDKDKDKEGNLKKAHHHVLFHSDNPRSDSAIRKLVNRVFDCEYLSYVETVSRPDRYFEYLYHGDDFAEGGKAAYKAEDVKLLNNFQVPMKPDNLEEIKKQEVAQSIAYILQLCEENEIYTLSALCKYLVSISEYDVLYYVQGHAFFVKELLPRPVVPVENETGLRVNGGVGLDEQGYVFIR